MSKSKKRESGKTESEKRKRSARKLPLFPLSRFFAFRFSV